MEELRFPLPESFLFQPEVNAAAHICFHSNPGGWVLDQVLWVDTEFSRIARVLQRHRTSGRYLETDKEVEIHTYIYIYIYIMHLYAAFVKQTAASNP